MLLIALLGAVGLALGYLLSSMALGPSGAPAGSVGAVRPDTANAAGACPPTADPAEIQAEIDATKAQASFVEGQLGLVGGLPSPWPDPADGPTEEARHRETIGAALDELDGLLHWGLDCDEDPCILALSLDREIDRETVARAQKIARDADLPTPILPWQGLGEHSPARVELRAGLPANPDPSVTARTQHRAFVLLERLSAPNADPPAQ